MFVKKKQQSDNFIPNTQEETDYENKTLLDFLKGILILFPMTIPVYGKEFLLHDIESILKLIRRTKERGK